ncbi:MAG: hypothetical protein QXS54_12240 [Candidatus Methanomethylicaceae archaeon]
MLTILMFFIGVIAGIALTALLHAAGRDEELMELKTELEKAHERQKHLEEQIIGLRRALLEKERAMVAE